MPNENTDMHVDVGTKEQSIPASARQQQSMPPYQPAPPQPIMPGMCPPPQQPMPPQPPIPMCPPPMSPQPPRKDGREFAIAAFVISIIALFIAIGGVLIGLVGVGVGIATTTTCDTASVDNGTSAGGYDSNDSEDDNDMIAPRLMSLDK